MRFFNTAGPVNCEYHYCLPPLQRFDLNAISRLIQQQKYFVLHAPRQAGKTTFLLALTEYLNQMGQYRCLYGNVESGQSARENVQEVIRAILSELGSRARITLNDSFIENHWSDILAKSGPHGALNEILTQWAEQSPQPTVLLLDEIDSLIGDSLIAVLRQIRSGYDKRPKNFPQCVILCGVRDVRDYRIHVTGDKESITGGSAFNIKAESLRLGNFSQDDVLTLYQQHTEETGQLFNPEALDLVWHLTQGQPWLTNALGYEVCFNMPIGQDRNQPITTEMILQAKETLIVNRVTHLDQLVDKLREERVRRVIEPILAGETTPESLPTDDVLYVQDLGLIQHQAGQLTIANPIYQEVIPRELTFTTQLTISHQPTWYIKPDGRLDVQKLVAAFQQFFREHSEHWLERFNYKEAGPQLLLQAFLQRVVNGGGRVEREYGLGRQRTDLFLTWPHPQGTQKIVFELKILYGSLAQTIEDGLNQTWAYMDKTGSSEGHLIIFDRRENRAWQEKIFRQERVHAGQAITIWGM